MDVVKTTIFVDDIKNFDAINAVYAKTFKIEPPARSFVQVAALPKGAHVEIEVIARRWLTAAKQFLTMSGDCRKNFYKN